MNSRPFCVHVIVDPLYGTRLRDLPVDEPMWVIDTEANRPVIEAIWKDRPAPKHPEGITSFKYDTKGNPESWFFKKLPTIDMHHGEFSHDPPYSILNIIGIDWSAELGKELDKHGFIKYEQTTESFKA